MASASDMTLPESLPSIGDEDQFGTVVQELSYCICEAIDVPHTFEQLRIEANSRSLKPLISWLSETVHHPAVIAALLALKWHFSALEPDGRAINETRACACEIVAWRFLMHLSVSDAIDAVLYELPTSSPRSDGMTDAEQGHTSSQTGSPCEPQQRLSEASPLLSGHNTSPYGLPQRPHRHQHNNVAPEEKDPTILFEGLNALEIAVVADAKRFLSQKPVQKIVNGIWDGDIVFWDSMSVHSKKKAHLYNPMRTDPYCRLRVPRYQKAFEVLFFASFIGLYYAVLVERNPESITPTEIVLYVWIAAFAYDEIGDFKDAGLAFYSRDFWSMWDLGIIGIGIAYFIARVIELIRHTDQTNCISFDILSLEALFLVPRICSVLSLNPYFGTLIPCLKEMTKDFIKFLGLVAVLYVGWLTTFTLLARDQFGLSDMSWILIKVFFGSSYLGFDVARKISPVLGPPLMIIFVCMTNILLITSLISLLSNSLTKVMDHAREEYLYIYSVFVLEAASSSRLTYFEKPLNLIPLLIVRPLRLFLPSHWLRSARILLLKATHFPFVGAIRLFEGAQRYFSSVDRQRQTPQVVASSIPKRPFLVRNDSLLRSPHDGNFQRALKGRVAFAEQNVPHAEERRSNAQVAEASSDLIAIVQKLSLQVEELTATIAQQRNKEEEDS